ncbi:MAG TPA: CHAP domain-containing protein [Polyangia bacterium]|nr:CHAP domain-containing protein [Polyangia bacterium]
MSLPLPGERPVRFLEIFLVVASVLGLCALGCGTPRAGTRATPSVFQAARLEARRPQPPARGAEDADFVERTLHDAGLRFGTDGSTRALWGYLRTAHRLVDAASARPGDVLFFDTRGVAPGLECADETGIVEEVAPDGRIAFISAHGGRIHRGFVDPARPTTRRDGRGQILNSFLRPKRMDDPPGARYFAGEMLCGIARAKTGA